MDDDASARVVEGEVTDELPANMRMLPGGKGTDEAERARKAQEKEEKLKEKYELIRRRLRVKWEEEGKESDEWTPPPEEERTTVIERYAMTCMGNADRLRHHYGHILRFVAGTGSRSGYWLWHDGVRWRRDDTRRIKFYARETVKKIMDEAEMARSIQEALDLAAWCEKSQGASAINGMISLAEPLLAAAPEDLVAQRERLVTGAGLVDLRTGQLLPPDDKNFDVHWTPVVYDLPVGDNGSLWELRFRQCSFRPVSRVLRRMPYIALGHQPSHSICQHDLVAINVYPIEIRMPSPEREKYVRLHRLVAGLHAVLVAVTRFYYPDEHGPPA